MVKCSVVIIGKNEEHIIGKSIESVIQCVNNIGSAEIAYVDSYSSDRSVHIAKQYPIDVYQLKPDWVHTAPAGRHIGYLNTTGEYMFFLDGDCTVDKDWLDKAIGFLDKNNRVAGVAGILDEVYLDKKNQITSRKDNKYRQKKEIESVALIGGPAVYKRSVFNDVGPFNPYLSCDEERELNLRMRKAGYHLARLLIPMATKFGPDRESFAEITDKLGNDAYALGRTWKYCQKNGFFRQYAKERLGFVFQFSFVILLLIGLVLFTLILNQPAFLLGLFIFFVLGIGVLSVKRKSLIKVLVSIAKRSIITFKTFYTFLTTRAKTIDSYPTDAIIIQCRTK